MWKKDEDGKGYSITQSDLDEQKDTECPAKCGGRGVHRIQYNAGYRTAECVKCGTLITIIED
jgi:hypothetical protein